MVANPTPSAVPAEGSVLRQYILGDGFLSGEIKKALGTFNPRMVGTKERLMMRLDPDIAFGLAIVRSPIVNCQWSVESRDPEIAAFVDQTFRPIWRGLTMGMSNAIPLGAMLQEKVWQGGPVDIEIDDDPKSGKANLKSYPAAWTYRRFKTIDPRTYNYLVNDDEVAGVEQFLLGGQKLGTPTRVGMERLVHWAFRSEDAFGSPHGLALLDQAYEPWYFSTALSLICNRYFERLADPPVKGRAYNRVKLGDGSEIDGFRFLLDQIASIRSGGGIVLPNDMIKGTDKFAWDFELLLSDQRGAMFDGRLMALTIQKLRALLITDKAATAGDGTGSLAQATEHGDRLNATLDAILEEALEVINLQAVYPEVLYNFGKERADSSRTRIRTAGITAGKKSLYSDIMKAVISAEATIQGTGRPMFIDLVEMKAMAKEAGVPMKPLDDVVELIGVEDKAAKAAGAMGFGAPGAQDPNADPAAVGAPDEAAIAESLKKDGVENAAETAAGK